MGVGNTVGFDGAYVGNEYTFYNHTYGTFGTLNKCTAQNGYNGVGVYAQSVCFNHTLLANEYELECAMVLGNKTSGTTQSGTPSIAKCPSPDYFMSSCSGYSWWNSVGQYAIENDECIVTDNRAGIDGNGVEVHSVASGIWYVSNKEERTNSVVCCLQYVVE